MQKENSKNKRTLRTDPSNWKTGTSTTFFGDFTEKDMDACRNAGIECIEITQIAKWYETEGPDSLAHVREISQKSRNIGLEVWSVHLPFGHQWDISVNDSSLRKQIVNKQVELLDLASNLHPQKAVIHASWEPVEPSQREDCIKAANDALFILTEKAQVFGIQLAVECLPRTCIGNNSGDILKLIRDNTGIGVCFDTNHLLTESAESFIEKVGNRIVTLHVSDYDRIDEMHWLPGRGLNNWNSIIDMLAENGYNGPFMFEISQKNSDRTLTPVDFKECHLRLLEEYRKFKGGKQNL